MTSVATSSYISNNTQYKCIDVRNLDKRKVIEELWNNSQPAIAAKQNQKLDQNELISNLNGNSSLWYLSGRPIKIPNFSDDYWVCDYYDKSNCAGAMNEVIDAYRDKIDKENNNGSSNFYPSDSQQYNCVDVRDVDKMDLVRELWRYSDPAIAADPNQKFNIDEVKASVNTGNSCWYISGRPIKIPNFNDNFWISDYYDQSTGIGAMNEIVNAYREKLNNIEIKKNM